MAHTALRDPVPVACHGVFLDALSATSHIPLISRDGSALSNPADILLCPKPHIGPWRVDLVSRSRHCCKEPHLCHILGQPGAQVPIKPPRDISDLLEEIQQIVSRPEAAPLDDDELSLIVERVQTLTRHFAAFVGVDFEFYYHRLRDLGMVHSLELLGPIQRESLALSEFLKDQLDRIKANDYSASAIHISSVIEVELKQRIFQCPGLVGDLANPKRQTLGVLPYLQRSYDSDGNWARITAYVGQHWNERPDPDDPTQLVPFDNLISKAINRIAQLRNTAAHTDPLSRREYTELQGLVFQGGKLGYGALNAILLGWK